MLPARATPRPVNAPIRRRPTARLVWARTNAVKPTRARRERARDRTRSPALLRINVTSRAPAIRRRVSARIRLHRTAPRAPEPTSATRATAAKREHALDQVRSHAQLPISATSPARAIPRLVSAPIRLRPTAPHALARTNATRPIAARREHALDRIPSRALLPINATSQARAILRLVSAPIRPRPTAPLASARTNATKPIPARRERARDRTRSHALLRINVTSRVPAIRRRANARIRLLLTAPPARAPTSATKPTLAWQVRALARIQTRAPLPINATSPAPAILTPDNAPIHQRRKALNARTAIAAM